MVFSLHPAVGGALAALMGPNPPPPHPVGEVQGRRATLDAMFGSIFDAQAKVTDVQTQDFTTKADDGHELLLRWYTKAGGPNPGPAVFYSHGGGMIALQLRHYDELLKRYVSVTGVPFLAVEYRLAPEVQAPVPVTDAYAGLRYLVAHAAELGVDPNRIAIMGDSAGGGITASLAHYCKLRGGPFVAKQILIYPMLDDRNTVPDPAVAPFCTWTYDDNITGWGALLGDRIGTDNVDVTEAAGRMTAQDARGLPPAYIDVGELDLFRDEDLEYARNLGKGGVPCEFHLVPAVPHAYEAFAPDSEPAKFIIEQRIKAVKSI